MDTVRSFVDREVKPTVRELEHANTYPEAWIEQMKRIGIFGLAISERYGGTPVSMPSSPATPPNATTAGSAGISVMRR